LPAVLPGFEDYASSPAEPRLRSGSASGGSSPIHAAGGADWRSPPSLGRPLTKQYGGSSSELTKFTPRVPTLPEHPAVEHHQQQQTQQQQGGIIYYGAEPALMSNADFDQCSPGSGGRGTPSPNGSAGSKGTPGSGLGARLFGFRRTLSGSGGKK
jgi:hypothetical protein